MMPDAPAPSSSSTASNKVEDGEILYRAVADNPRMFPDDGQGGRRISSLAFNDPGRRPSVDRAILCSGGPDDTRQRFSAGSGVLSLSARDARGLTTTHGQSGQVYGVDVEPVPLSDNSAHAEIFGRPPFDTDKIFDRIKQALARIAVVSIPPDSIARSE